MTGRHRAPGPLYTRPVFWQGTGYLVTGIGAVVATTAAPLGWAAGLCVGGLAVQYLAIRPTLRQWAAIREVTE